MGLAVNVLCRNLGDDRVIPRFSRYLRDYLGWHLTARPDPAAEVYYLSGYFEWSVMRREMADRPTAAYFTHLETQPPGNGKAKLFHELGKMVDLRIVTAEMYAETLMGCGPTAQISPPVERSRFVIPPQRGKTLTAGFSGYTYGNGRKGEALGRELVKAHPKVTWKASGKGWPVPTRRYTWAEMAGFYQSLDILVITATVEGIPMPPLEALACGVSVVIPRGVGLLNELPDIDGIHRYKRGSESDLVRAFHEAATLRPYVDREALRAATEPYSILAWCEQHRATFDEVFS
jgi:glycosyltransferase involved in cell wall biosynthesis